MFNKRRCGIIEKISNLKLRPIVVGLWLLQRKYNNKAITADEYLYELEKVLKSYYQSNDALELWLI